MRARRIGVVVVTYNSAAVLGAALDSVTAGSDGLVVGPVVVVDNASTDDLGAVLPGGPTIRLVELGRNAGYAAGVNAGVVACGDVDAVLIMNPDVRLHRGTLAALAAGLDRPGVGIVVPRLLDPDGTLHHSLRRAPSIRRAVAESLIGGRRASRLGDLGEVVGDPGRYTRAGVADWATGAVMLLSRECLTITGTWDESFLLYAEETDFALRAGDAGFRLWFTPEAVATHIGGESNTSPYLWGLLTLNRVRLYRKRHNRVAGALFAAAVALNEAVRAVAGRRTARAALTVLIRPSKRPRALPQS